MSFAGKLGFIHRRLWAGDGWYRAAFLFGPAALLGAAIAGAAWGGMQLARGDPAAAPPRWAVPAPGAPRWTADGEAQTLDPARALPAIGADGALAGFETGWRASAHAIALLPTLDVAVKPDALFAFPLQGASIDMAEIAAAGPAAAPLHVAIGDAALAIRAGGIHALTLRFERPAAPAADCLVRLALGGRRIVSEHFVGLSGPVSRTFEAPALRLAPGLYPMGWAFGCWRDGRVAGPGRITLMMAPPGAALSPAPAEDIVRPRNP